MSLAGHRELGPFPTLPCALTSLQGARNSPSGGTGPTLSGTGGLLWVAPGNPQCVDHPVEENRILGSSEEPRTHRHQPSSLPAVLCHTCMSLTVKATLRPSALTFMGNM